MRPTNPQGKFYRLKYTITILIQILHKLQLLNTSFKVIYLSIIKVRQKLSFEVYHYEKIPKLVGKAEATVG